MVYKNIRNILVLVLITVWLAVFNIDNKLHIIACDVGQGDAILIQKNTTQILIDSGSGNKVLDCLGRYMPFWDRQIELAISTHIDKDHSGGFVDVFNRYKIVNFLTNDLNNPMYDTLTARVIKKVVGGSGTKVIYPDVGMVIRVGVMYLDILHPYEGFSSKNTNDYSVVNLVRYGNFKAIFTGDIELNISENIFERNKIEPVDYIKISHHGSKNGTSEKLLQILKPKIAIISVGKNSYGHPNEEVINLLKKYNIKILRTDLEGDVDYIVD
ncbi:MAG: MBL fold metallo-hydrolase [Candidatus Woesebacteria bacterium]|nr:MBL fold metallo-hydrolase [Candidatus Woesebacteria bacterium]